ncbi:unnamed protein product [Malus baccata var. baccata]
MYTNEDFKSVFLEMLHREICVGHSLLCVGQSLQVQAATPKQIRELMKFDGLTNDEVKSHLQVCICDYPSVLNHNLVDVNKILHIHDRNWKSFCMRLVMNFFTHTCDYPCEIYIF